MADKPRVLLRSKLKLNRVLEDRLMAHVMKRRSGVRMECGWMDSIATTGLGVYGTQMYWRGMAATGWARKRQEAYAQYENDFTFRTLPGNARRFSSIFKIFNTSQNLPARAVNVYKARACEALFNTDPFSGFMPKGQHDDADAIKLAERVFANALNDAEAAWHFRESVTQACLSEAVLKTTLVPKGGNPETIENAQLWLEQDPVGGTQLKRDSRGAPIFSDEPLDDDPEVLGLQVLKRDPVTKFTGREVLSSPQTMMRDTPVSAELSIRPTGWENFFCGVTEPSIHTSDCIIHEFDEDYDSLLRRTENVRLNQSAKAWLSSVANSEQRYQQAIGAQPHWNCGEWELGFYGPVRLLISEQWCRFDVYDRGRADELCVTWAVGGMGTEAYPVYYDLMQDASPTGKRPFEVMRVIPVRDRWYGFGFYDLLSTDHEFVDDAWNRVRARSSASGRLDVIREDSFKGYEYGKPLSLSGGKCLILKASIPPDSPIESHVKSIPFPELDEHLYKMIEEAKQVAQLRSGTMTAGDAASSDMPANNTATGQNLLANESELMSNDSTQDLIRGTVATLKQAICAVFGRFDQVSANLLLGVDDAAVLSQWLQTAKPEQFSKHVKLLLTKARSKQALEAAEGANLTLTGGVSFIQLLTENLPMAKVMKPFFVDMLTARDISNADQVIDQMIKTAEDQLIQQPPMAPQPGAGPQTLPAPTAPPPVTP